MPKEIPLPIAGQESENLCLTSCQAACCQDIYIAVSQDDLKKFTPEKTKENKETVVIEAGSTVLNFSEMKGSVLEGIYVVREEENIYIYIAGPCPNLNADFSCGIHEDRPESCRALEVASTYCTQSRQKIGLPSLDPSFEIEEARSFVQSLKGWFNRRFR